MLDPFVETCIRLSYKIKNQMKWRSDITIDDLMDGDIIETKSKIPQHSPILRGVMVPFIKHYGMIVYIEGKRNIVHNIIGRCPTITPCEEIFVDRRLERVLRTGMCGDEIMERFNSCQGQNYDLFSWNCENLMVYISGSSIGIPQRDIWTGGTLMSVAIVIAIFLIFGGKTKS